MPWSSDDYPTSWKNQPKKVRDKAIEIGNALLSDGMDEGRAIPIALSQARKALDVDADGADLWVTPADDGWRVKAEGEDRAIETFDRQDEAIEHAVDLAREHGLAVTVQGRDGQIRDRQSFRSRLS
jgi:uncharacterized protein YdaT